MKFCLQKPNLHCNAKQQTRRSCLQKLTLLYVKVKLRGVYFLKILYIDNRGGIESYREDPSNTG